MTDPTDDDRLAAASRALLRGEAVVVPTDTVYGVAALPSVAGATGRLFDLKHRSQRQALAVLVADAEQATSLTHDLAAAEVRSLVAAHWPGPLTLVVRRSAAAVDLDLGGDPATVGIRCPAHPLVRELAARVGPIATTSANRSGEPTPTTAAAAAAALDGPVAVVLDGGPCDGVPSTVLDVTGLAWRVLRQGPIHIEITATSVGPGRPRGAGMGP